MGWDDAQERGGGPVGRAAEDVLRLVERENKTGKTLREMLAGNNEGKMNIKINNGFVWVNGKKYCDHVHEIFSELGMEVLENPIATCDHLAGQADTIGGVNQSIDRVIESLTDILRDCGMKPPEKKSQIATMLESLAKRFDRQSNEWNNVGGSVPLAYIRASIFRELCVEFTQEKKNWK